MLDRNADFRYNIKMTCLDSLVPAGHLLRKIDNTVDFTAVYGMVEHLYCDDNGRPAVDPVVLVKMVLLQHLYGIESLRQTVQEVAGRAIACAARELSGCLQVLKKSMVCAIHCTGGLIE